MYDQVMPCSNAWFWIMYFVPLCYMYICKSKYIIQWDKIHDSKTCVWTRHNLLFWLAINASLCKLHLYLCCSFAIADAMTACYDYELRPHTHLPATKGPQFTTVESPAASWSSDMGNNRNNTNKNMSLNNSYASSSEQVSTWTIHWDGHVIASRV